MEVWAARAGLPSLRGLAASPPTGVCAVSCRRARGMAAAQPNSSGKGLWFLCRFSLRTFMSGEFILGNLGMFVVSFNKIAVV